VRIKRLLVVTLASALGAPVAGAQDHLVRPAAAQERLAEAAALREQNNAVLVRVLKSPAAAGALAQLGTGAEAIAGRLPSLSDAELASLAQRAQALRADPLAGDFVIDLNDVLILLLIVAIVIVVVRAAN